MRGRYFLDSNVILYSFDAVSEQKRSTARQLIAESLGSARGTISTQVAQECLNFLSNAKGKAALGPTELSAYWTEVLQPLCAHLSPLALFPDALRICDRQRYGFYDSLIIAAALRLECETLYSEDMKHGHRIEDLTIINPFLQ